MIIIRCLLSYFICFLFLDFCLFDIFLFESISDLTIVVDLRLELPDVVLEEVVLLLLSAIKVKGCKKLKNLRFDNTALTKINVKTSPALQRLRCENTLLTKLNLKKNTKLKNLRCENTRLTQLDLSNTKIKDDSALQCDPAVSVTYAG